MDYFGRLIADEAIEIARRNTGIPVPYVWADGFSTAEPTDSAAGENIIKVLTVCGDWQRIADGETVRSAIAGRMVAPAVIAGAILATVRDFSCSEDWTTMHIFPYGEVVHRIRAARLAARRKAREAFPLAEDGTRRRRVR